MADTSKPGLGSNKMDKTTKDAIHRAGGKASGTTARTTTSNRGAAGKTEAARRGGLNSHRND